MADETECGDIKEDEVIELLENLVVELPFNVKNVKILNIINDLYLYQSSLSLDTHELICNILNNERDYIILKDTYELAHDLWLWVPWKDLDIDEIDKRLKQIENVTKNLKYHGIYISHALSLLRLSTLSYLQGEPIIARALLRPVLEWGLYDIYAEYFYYNAVLPSHIFGCNLPRIKDVAKRLCEEGFFNPFNELLKKNIISLWEVLSEEIHLSKPRDMVFSTISRDKLRIYAYRRLDISKYMLGKSGHKGIQDINRSLLKSFPYLKHYRDVVDIINVGLINLYIKKGILHIIIGSEDNLKEVMKRVDKCELKYTTELIKQIV